MSTPFPSKRRKKREARIPQFVSKTDFYLVLTLIDGQLALLDYLALKNPAQYPVTRERCKEWLQAFDSVGPLIRQSEAQLMKACTKAVTLTFSEQAVLVDKVNFARQMELRLRPSADMVRNLFLPGGSATLLHQKVAAAEAAVRPLVMGAATDPRLS